MQVGTLLEAITPASTPRGTPLGPQAPGSQIGRVVILPFLPAPICVFIATQQTVIESLNSGARLQVPHKEMRHVAWQVFTFDTNKTRQHVRVSYTLTLDVAGHCSTRKTPQSCNISGQVRDKNNRAETSKQEMYMAMGLPEEAAAAAAGGGGLGGISSLRMPAH